jgi:hypothetical protein
VNKVIILGLYTEEYLLNIWGDLRTLFHADGLIA